MLTIRDFTKEDIFLLVPEDCHFSVMVMVMNALL
jgi:hypothetical protein